MLKTLLVYTLPTVEDIKLELATISSNCEKEVTHVRLQICGKAWQLVSGDIFNMKPSKFSSFISVFGKATHFKNNYEGLAHLLITRVKTEIAETHNV